MRCASESSSLLQNRGTIDVARTRSRSRLRMENEEGGRDSVTFWPLTLGLKDRYLAQVGEVGLKLKKK